MKLAIMAIVALTAAGLAAAQALPIFKPVVRHVIGLDTVKHNATGSLVVQDGMLEFTAGKTGSKVPVASIDDVFVGTETTQPSSKTARVVKTAAIAAPYESGRALTILLRTKVDILTVSFHDADGALHGAIFALPVGQAQQMRSQLIQAGAHATPIEK